MMKQQHGSVLVTGANGFVGSAVVKALAAGEDRRVVAAVRGRAGGISSQKSVSVVADLDLESFEAWREVLQGIDAVVHCAARVHVMSDSAVDPLAEFRKVNVEGTLNLAKAAVEAGVSRFIYLSSVKVLGETTNGRGPFNLDDEKAPEDPYGRSKAEAEAALGKFCVQHSMELVIVRPPLVYGPGVGGNFLSLLKLASTPFPLPFGGLRNLRSMVYVENLADFIVRCVDCPVLTTQVLHVSDGEDLSTQRLLALIRAGLGRTPWLFTIPEGVFHVAGRIIGKSAAVDRLLGSLQVDCSKSFALLDWTPPYSVGKALQRTAKAYLDRTF